jgi:hypothetical protein
MILLTFFINKEWQAEFEKRFLLVGMTIYGLLYALSFASFLEGNLSQTWCEVQAAAIQAFGNGILMHEAMISYELYYEVDILTREAKGDAPPTTMLSVDCNDHGAPALQLFTGQGISLYSLIERVPQRFVVFEAGVVLYNAIFVVILFATKDVSTFPGLGR